MLQMKANVYITLERLLEVPIDKFHVDIIISNFHRNILNSLENADKHILRVINIVLIHIKIYRPLN